MGITSDYEKITMIKHDVAMKHVEPLETNL